VLPMVVVVPLEIAEAAVEVAVAGHSGIGSFQALLGKEVAPLPVMEVDFVMAVVAAADPVDEAIVVAVKEVVVGAGPEGEDETEQLDAEVDRNQEECNLKGIVALRTACGLVEVLQLELGLLVLSAVGALRAVVAGEPVQEDQMGRTELGLQLSLGRKACVLVEEEVESFEEDLASEEEGHCGLEEGLHSQEVEVAVHTQEVAFLEEEVHPFQVVEENLDKAVELPFEWHWCSIVARFQTWLELDHSHSH